MDASRAQALAAGGGGKSQPDYRREPPVRSAIICVDLLPLGYPCPIATPEVLMPKPNYAFAKRQRELAKKQKKEAKKQQKMGDQAPGSPDAPPTEPPATPSQG
jgi:hypothetical protein